MGQSLFFHWWQLMMEPGRLWKRCLIGNLIFIRLVFKEAVKRRRTK